MHPKLKTLDEALEIVRTENAKVVEKEGLVPQPSTLQYRLIQSGFAQNEWEVKRTSEPWAREMLAHHRWAQWIDNDLLERLRRDGPEKEPRRATKAALEDHALRLGPQYRNVPADAMAWMMGVEMVDEG